MRINDMGMTVHQPHIESFQLLTELSRLNMNRVTLKILTVIVNTFSHSSNMIVSLSELLACSETKSNCQSFEPEILCTTLSG